MRNSKDLITRTVMMASVALRSVLVRASIVQQKMSDVQQFLADWSSHPTRYLTLLLGGRDTSIAPEPKVE